MAKKSKTAFICQNCATTHTQWQGKCEGCGEWNTIVEDNPLAGIGGGPGRAPKKGRVVPLASLDGEIEEAPRIISRVAELDRVTGGGFVRGSAVLLGGEPGIGKSTLLMQAAAALSRAGHNIVYVSGEEAVAQVRLRAKRLKANETQVLLAAETNVEDILTTLNDMEKRPDLVIIDSIQTMWTDSADSAPGTVTQVRQSAQALIRYAKSTGATVVMVGHVTKEGNIAGPRVVEHMVDAVIQFEGDGSHQYRILRALKNRFGPTDEIGVFEMMQSGLRQVANPSELFLGERADNAPGAAVFGGMEGTRPLLVEIQALVAPTSLGTPRRAVVGWDSARLSMIIAVLQAHCGVNLGQHDVYLNVAGGYRISEPAADLAVACALISSLAGLALPTDCVYFGEISLSGSIRPVPHAGQRIKEAEKLGFKSAVLPKGSSDVPKRNDESIFAAEKLVDLVVKIAGGKTLSYESDEK
ncbi:DNA repair protein RadA [Ahrensia sp. 13_GOM-1096m]|uniref:DNA repair protein RadA n=1 Tax=Ahrensia sp. 13_GOM-1096m TaxID=1380380 RepID=UPI00047A5859|nr:DNA repair protein RadA [Ahrensia sp. 13_GOM-1096m]